MESRHYLCGQTLNFQHCLWCVCTYMYMCMCVSKGRLNLEPCRFMYMYMYMYICDWMWENLTFCRFHQHLLHVCLSDKFTKYEHLQWYHQ